MKRIIAEEKPNLLGADQDRFAAALAYQDRDLEEELSIIELTRPTAGPRPASLPESALQRQGVHNERGPLTLEQLLQIAVNHITHHSKFIEEKRMALGLK